ncbi:MAG: XRE family transcriptional regulator [Sphingobacteriales bacterium]|nr:MAG: XRE family transcriptional regulator [Sphingobacteriales bacterium]
MLLFDLSFILAERGINNPVSYLQQAGFPPHTAARLVEDSRYRVTFDQLEKLCLMLHCTPNELLKWDAPRHSQVPQSHPLQKLCRPQEKSLAARLLKLPVDKLSMLHDYAQQLDRE